MNNFQKLRGFSDILPEESKIWQEIEFRTAKFFRNSSINEIRTPLLENTSLFARGIGEATDVVGKEMYTFLDRGERSCTLRPEGTASVVRSFLENKLIAKGPQKLWYLGPMFRYERPQAGRLRQFHQIGVEYFGFKSANSDVEIISLAWGLLQLFDLNNLVLQINSLGSFDDRKNYKKILVNWLQEREDLLDDDSIRNLSRNPLRILDSKDPKIRNILEDVPLITDYLCDESLYKYQKVKDLLVELQIPFIVNPLLVRGLDYYSHIAFEITSDDLGSQATVCGGGRYDGLLNQLGKLDCGAIGFAIGLERLLMLIDKNKFVNNLLDVFILNKGEKSEIEALKISRYLRGSGIHVEVDNTDSSISKQFKRASKLSPKWLIIIGDQGLKSDEIKLKPYGLNKNNGIMEQILKITEQSKLLSLITDND